MSFKGSSDSSIMMTSFWCLMYMVWVYLPFPLVTTQKNEEKKNWFFIFWWAKRQLPLLHLPSSTYNFGLYVFIRLILIIEFWGKVSLQKSGAILAFLNRQDSTKKCWYSLKCLIPTLFFLAFCSAIQRVWP